MNRDGLRAPALAAASTLLGGCTGAFPQSIFWYPHVANFSQSTGLTLDIKEIFNIYFKRYTESPTKMYVKNLQ